MLRSIFRSSKALGHDSILSKSNLFDWSTALSLALFIGIVVGIVIYHHAPMIIGKVWLFNEQTRNSNSRASPSKRKKSRKSEKGKKELSENGDDSEDVSGLDLNKLFDCGADGPYKIGEGQNKTDEEK
ncbi:hypothetical protein CsatA_025937 [Cannabis sativa]